MSTARGRGSWAGRMAALLIGLIVFTSGVGVGVLAAPPSGDGIWSGDWIREAYAYISSGLQLAYTTPGRLLIAGPGGNVTTDSGFQVNTATNTLTIQNTTFTGYLTASQDVNILGNLNVTGTSYLGATWLGGALDANGQDITDVDDLNATDAYLSNLYANTAQITGDTTIGAAPTAGGSLTSHSTVALTVTGNIYDVHILSTGAYVYAVARGIGAGPGVAEVPATFASTTWFYKNAGWPAGFGPESIYKYADGNYVQTDCDADPYNTREITGAGAIVYDVNIQSAESRPMTLNGVEVVACAIDDGVTIIRRDTQATYWQTHPNSAFTYINSVDLQTVDGDYYFWLADFNGHKIFRIRYSDKVIDKTFTTDAVNGPYDVRVWDDKYILVAEGAGGTYDKKVTLRSMTDGSVVWSSPACGSTTIGADYDPANKYFICIADNTDAVKTITIPPISNTGTLTIHGTLNATGPVEFETVTATDGFYSNAVSTIDTLYTQEFSAQNQNGLIYYVDRYDNIQACVDAAPNGSTIVLGAKTYTENVILSNRGYLIFVGTPGLTIWTSSAGDTVHCHNANAWIRFKGIQFSGEAVAGVCVRLNGDSEQFAWDDCQFTTASYGIVVVDDDSGTKEGFKVLYCRFSTASGVLFTDDSGGDLLYNSLIFGNQFYCATTGVTYNGNDCRIVGNYFNCAGSRILTGASASYVTITGNELLGAGVITLNGDNIKIYGNPGYVTENSGTATILNATMSIAFAHGLSATPLASWFSITFTENPTNPTGNWWLTCNATHAVLNVAADPGASNLDFSWQARKP